MEQDKNIRKERLTAEELTKIVNLKLEPQSALWHCRNFFMFSFYTAGIRVSDMIQLKWGNIIDGRVQDNMDKTGGFKSIKISKPIQDILDFYRTKKVTKDDFVFPLRITKMITLIHSI